MNFTCNLPGIWWARALVFVAFTALGCDPAGSFPCGSGTCDIATQICMIGDGCSTCLPRPAACDASLTCGCLPPASDPSWAANKCDDEGACAEVEGGLVLTCNVPHEWGCG